MVLGCTPYYSPLSEGKRCFAGLFEESYHRSRDSPKGVDTDEVALFKVNADYLEKGKVVTDKKACGIPFMLKEAEVLERARAHHKGAIQLQSVERILLPFWLTRTAATGSFRAEVLQNDPAFMTQPHCFVWVEGPRYDFNYPFEEYMPCNQTCACYTEPLELVESCLQGSHIPSMLISRFELLQDLEAELNERRERGKLEDKASQAFDSAPLRIIPFTMSTQTALSTVEKRVTRAVVMERVEKELRKFHGRFLRSNVSLTSISFQATQVRPVFLPLYKLSVTTPGQPHPLPLYVCGATGKTVGPVVQLSPKMRSVFMSGAGLCTLATVGLSGTGTLPVALIAAGSAAAASTSAVQWFRLWQAQQQWKTLLLRLKKTGELNFSSDEGGYRWSVDDEERQEYEYREYLRHNARKKVEFQQRVKEETRREYAKSSRHVDAKRRSRTDLVGMDPLQYYAILGLSGKEMTATSKDIAKAFREAVRIHHPDVRSHVVAEQKKPGMTMSSEGEEVKETSVPSSEKTHMQKLIEAYKVLHNAETKKAYDSGQLKKSNS